MSEPLCSICGIEHAPLDLSRRHYYATAPGTASHVAEVAWFETHGVRVVHAMKRLEAFLHGVAPGAADPLRASR